ncbi:hypothetical protein BGZ74_008356 [Mortierella antarctica]|nr:hypothetical protein BGZ74_008356 [Mortierella antarctica]
MRIADHPRCAAIALLALSHVEAATIIPTPEDIEKYGKDYAARVLEHTKAYYKCRSDCYNEALQSVLAPDNDKTSFLDKLRVAKDITEIDLCVANEIRGFDSFDKIVAYEKKRAFFQITISQYCVDEVINKGQGVFDSKGKGKLTVSQALLKVQPKLLACSVQKCDADYVSALINATKDN